MLKIARKLRCPKSDIFLCLLKTVANIFFHRYGLTICAERTAIVKAVTAGERKFRAVAVTTDISTEFVYPCGKFYSLF